MVKLFFSYCHKDEHYRDEMEVHLTLLKRQGIISTWHDRRIIVGSEIDTDISSHLESANVIVLLVSPYFLASDYCYEKEMVRAMELHESGDAIVIPVILHPCDWHGAPFGKLLATPTDGHPISMHANQHEAFSIISKHIREAVESLSSDLTKNNVDQSILITIDDVGRLTQDETEFTKNLEKAKSFLTEKQSYQIKVRSEKYLSQYQHQCDVGINANISKKFLTKFNETEQALKLLISLWCNGHLTHFSEHEFVNMAKATLKFSDMSPYDPFLSRLDVWFTKNDSFRYTIDFSNSELCALFEQLGVGDMYDIQPDSVLKLPRTILCTKVIPAMVYSIEKYSDQALIFHVEEQFNLGFWKYGVA
ncbi:toll/interleukin-1 receptor domain-containing protein [Vibrio vulnificus]|uniref:toll/interleukin-1 receptor domain-containing protein n=1 Tax=Vibrio vulnificus TaxID=672 RepID=UPI001CDC8F91|nr:TIR domain-containing protein [Vibrio vulnificus]